MNLSLVPTTLREANAFIVEHHRHHGEDRGCVCVVATADRDAVIGVAIVGRPKARELQDGFTAEVTRLCVDPAWVAAFELGRAAGLHVRAASAGLRGLAHAEYVLRRYPSPLCSMLYSAAWRAVRALGYRRLVTYILGEESGASLAAAGWRCLGEAGGGSWSREGRPRIDTHPTQVKLRWERVAA